MYGGVLQGGQVAAGAVLLPPSEPVVEGPYYSLTVVMRLREPLLAGIRQPERWRRISERVINPSWLHRQGSGWLVMAIVGSRKRITNNGAMTRPLRHCRQRGPMDGSMGPLLAHTDLTVLIDRSTLQYGPNGPYI